MSYLSRVYRQRNPQAHDELKQKPFFSNQTDTIKADRKTGAFFQAKLSVNQPGDSYEREADSVASSVVNRSSVTPVVQQRKISSIQRLSTTPEEERVSSNDMRMERDKEKPFQRMGAEPEKEKPEEIQKKEELLKEKEETGESSQVQMKRDSGSPAASSKLSTQVEAAAGKGKKLPPKTIREMNRSFGIDFSQVQIHNDSESETMNKHLNAQAFTHGSDIYFSQGKFNPEAAEGKFLLAHELTHVVQQNKGMESLQRKPDDKHNLTSSKLSGDPKLEQCFDNELVIGKFSNGNHVKKLQEALMQLGIKLPKFGADKNYGDETKNAVIEFQKKAGMSASEWDGIVGRKTIGLLDESLRNNSISKDPDEGKNDLVLKDPKQKIKDDACKNKPKDEKCPDPNTTVNTGADQATALIDKVIAEQLPPKKTNADYPVIFSQLFRNNDSRNADLTVDEVKANYNEIKKFLQLIKTDPSHSRCGTDCDGGCRSGTPAYHNKAGGKHIITFCPGFNKDPERILIVLHECHHAAIPGSRDIAYQDTRLIDKLDHSKALLNAASFHLYAALVNDPKSDTIGQTNKDKNSISDPAQMKNVNLALGFIEQWFKLITFDMSRVSSDIESAKDQGKYSPGSRTDIINDIYAKWFGVTPAPAKPKDKDVQMANAIEERSKLMENAFKKQFTIQDSADVSLWERGPGKDIKLNQQLLILDMNHMVIGLLQELVHATPDISAESEPLYVGTVNDLRNGRKLDP